MNWRWQQLVEWLDNPKLGAEIGVKEGRCISHLLNNFPGLTMYAIDPWEQQEDGAEDYSDWDFDRIYHEFKKNTQHVHDNIIECRCYSEDAAELVPDGVLDFVFIDAQHDYASVKRDIQLWLPKVKKGGMISGHDYNPDPNRNYGVIEAVDEIFGEIVTGADFTWMKRIHE